jgi:hypothetical protein
MRVASGGSAGSCGAAAGAETAGAAGEAGVAAACAASGSAAIADVPIKQAAEATPTEAAIRTHDEEDEATERMRAAFAKDAPAAAPAEIAEKSLDREVCDPPRWNRSFSPPVLRRSRSMRLD